VDYNALEAMFLNGAVIKETRITEEFGYDDYLKQHSKIVPLFYRRNGDVELAEGNLPRVGDSVVAAVIE
jgi:hypothetical protein